MSSTHIFSSFSTSRARFLYRSFPSYFRTGISNRQYTIIVCRKHAELRNEVVPSRETGNSHHEGDKWPASRVKEQFDRREKSFRRKSEIFERMTQVASKMSTIRNPSSRLCRRSSWLFCTWTLGSLTWPYFTGRSRGVLWIIYSEDSPNVVGNFILRGQANPHFYSLRTPTTTEGISDRQGVPDKSVELCFNCKTLF